MKTTVEGATGRFTSTRTREMICGCCGSTFTQYELALAFYDWAQERAAMGGLARTALIHEIPDGFVPLMCVHCERDDLGLDSGRLCCAKRQEAFA